VREDVRLVGRKGWKERVYNREEWEKLLRMARNFIYLFIYSNLFPHIPFRYIPWE